MSRSHANRGKIWERQLDRYHHTLQRSGRALVTRNHPEVTIKRDRSGRVVGASHRATGAPDYTILSSGLTLMADAKSTRERRWALRLLEAHQANTLDAVENQGGLSLLLINTPEGSYAVLWSLVRPLWTRWLKGEAGRGEASLTGSQMQELSVCWEKKGVMLDYLGPALTHLKIRSAA